MTMCPMLAVCSNTMSGTTADSSETLHPSWEASRRQKKLMESLKDGPQNKKIKFDDD